MTKYTTYLQMCLNEECSLAFKDMPYDFPDGDTENRNTPCSECGEPTKRSGQKCYVGYNRFSVKSPSERKKSLKERSKKDTEKNWRETIREKDRKADRGE